MNYVDGAVTYLSPYISRGVISTKLVLAKLRARNFQFHEIEKLVQELAWRDYWQQVWMAKKEAINQDLRFEQQEVTNQQMPTAIDAANTGIHAIDAHIQGLKDSGYMHNHLRMYVAFLACNLGKSHWLSPAKWMYYHLLDGDWASNALSWQWVAGANAKKKYVANQENINRFCYSNQKNTFLDVSYEAFDQMACPDELKEISTPNLAVNLPKVTDLQVNQAIPTLLYTYYNLDPNWHQDINANRILILEPSLFAAYPVSQKCLGFVLDLAKNIAGIQVFVGEFVELKSKYGLANFIYKEHPLTTHFEGQQDSRDWMFGVTGYFPSFFAFWKKCKKEIKQW